MCLARKRVLSSLTGLVPFSRDHPAMNRWAIFGRPCGTGVHGAFGCVPIDWSPAIDFLLNQGRDGFHGRTRIPKSRQGRPTIAHGLNRGLRMQGRQEPCRGETKRRTRPSTKLCAGGAAAVRPLRPPHFPTRGEFRNVPGIVRRGSGINVALPSLALHLKRMSCNRSLYHWKSFRPAASKGFVEKVYLIEYLEVPLNHLCISECPSANEKAHAPL